MLNKSAEPNVAGARHRTVCSLPGTPGQVCGDVTVWGRQIGNSSAFNHNWLKPTSTSGPVTTHKSDRDEASTHITAVRHTHNGDMTKIPGTS